MMDVVLGTFPSGFHLDEVYTHVLQPYGIAQGFVDPDSVWIQEMHFTLARHFCDVLRHE